MNLLILNCFSRNSMAVMNHMGPAYTLYGAHVSGGSPLLDSVFKSPYLKRVFRHQSPEVDQQEFIVDLVSIVNSHDIDIIIPTGTTITDALALGKEDVETQTKARCLVGEFNKLHQLTDKGRFIALCQDNEIPIPKSVLLPDLGCLEREIEAQSFTFPLIIKPCRSFASHGVHIFESPADLRGFIQANGGRLKQEKEYVLQEKIDGSLHDVTSLSWSGKLVSGLTQKREVGLYDFGGGGIINRTTDEPELIEIAQRLVSALDWTGIALFDFIKDDQGSYFLLECNPKIWGTTELTIMAGLNYVETWIKAVQTGAEPIHNFSYEKDIVYKWWFPELLAHWLTKPRSMAAINRRIKNSFKSYDAARTITNLRLENILHLIGILINRSMNR